MAGFNEWHGLGNVGRDAELRYTAAGLAVASFSLACTKSWKDRGGAKKERTEWVQCVAFDRLAEVAGQYVRKGRQLFVTGELQTRDWVDDAGVKHYKTEIRVGSFQLLGRKEDGGRPADPPLDEYDVGELGPPLDLDKGEV